MKRILNDKRVELTTMIKQFLTAGCEFIFYLNDPKKHLWQVDRP